MTNFDENKCKYLINACAEILDMAAARPLTKLIYPDEWPEERGVKYDGVLGVDFSVHYGPQNTDNVFDKAIAGGAAEEDVFDALLHSCESVAADLEKLVPTAAKTMVGEYTDIIGHEIHVFVPYDKAKTSMVAEVREVMNSFNIDEKVEKVFAAEMQKKS